MVFLELFIAHLLGDFMFQSNDLIQKKYKSWTGVLEHVFIIMGFTILVLFPYWAYWQTWASAGTIFTVHFVQDYLKIQYDLRFNAKKSTLPYYLDQAFHIGLIYFLDKWFTYLEPLNLSPFLQNIYESKLLAIYVIGLVLFSFTYDITLFQYKRQKSLKAISYEPDYSNMAKRLALFSGAYVLFLLVLEAQLS